jgi:peptidoglycan L-alanyl-D-glutamate endopeptidase CwlK
LFSGDEYLEESLFYDSVGAIGKQFGLEWGGEWTSLIDKPHLKLKTGMTLAQIRDKFESGEAIV